MIYQWAVRCDQLCDCQDTLASDHLVIDAIILVTAGLAEWLVLGSWQNLPS